MRKFASKTAVDGVDLAVRTGEIYGFLGPNGAGKTTLIRMLCTLLRPSGGRAVVAGHDVVERPQEVRLRIGVALQEAALDDRQSGRELLALQGRLYGLRPGRGSAAHGRGAGPGRDRRRHRPADRHLLGGHEAPARSRRGPGPQPRGPLPRRADDGPRPREPGAGLGRGAEAQPGARDHHLPHHAVPGRGRRPGRTGRDHLAGPARRRGHPGAAEARRSVTTSSWPTSRGTIPTSSTGSAT